MTNHSSNPSPTTPPKPVPALPASPRRFSWLKWSIIVAIVVAVAYVVFVRPMSRSDDTAAAGGGGGRGGRGGRGGGGGGPMPVTAEPATTADLNVRIIALGTVTPVYTVTVRSRVDGELQKIYFEEGKTVEAGAPLADIDPRPFEVQKLQAEAQYAKDHAQLENAQVDLKRFQKLLEQDSVAGQQVDTQAALVRQYEAAIKVDQAQVSSAALQLAYAHITAPIAGRIGLRTVDQGNMVHSSDAGGIGVITQIHPITVLFSIPQDSVRTVIKNFGQGDPLVVEAYDRDGRTLLATGKLVTVDNQIDATTGTVKLRAESANADDALFPNQFVNVQLLVEQLKGVTVVPTASVQRGTSGTYVYVVSEEKTVSVRQIETGATERNSIVITKGLKAGEVVVVDGVDKLHDGSTVETITRSTTAPADGDKAGKRKGKGKRPPS